MGWLKSGLTGLLDRVRGIDPRWLYIGMAVVVVLQGDSGLILIGLCWLGALETLRAQSANKELSDLRAKVDRDARKAARVCEELARGHRATSYLAQTTSQHLQAVSQLLGEHIGRERMQ